MSRDNFVQKLGWGLGKWNSNSDKACLASMNPCVHAGQTGFGIILVSYPVGADGITNV